MCHNNNSNSNKNEYLHAPLKHTPNPTPALKPTPSAARSTTRGSTGSVRASTRPVLCPCNTRCAPSCARLAPLGAARVAAAISTNILWGINTSTGISRATIRTQKDVLYVHEPIVNEAILVAMHGAVDTAAAILTTYDDVFNFENLDGVLNDRKAVEVVVNDDIGNVAMHEDLPRVQLDDVVRGNARVGAA
ncbi:hypothetical protein BC936DRAFT_136969 [Jimgerdemannia flammicorona]|uniref:Uncharacterized protein n=1 Tax=Jimgerdemannia flammicorona TaxID=994334 RepID=A0A433CYC8_9FUNG|nr:hypothetical protein BC936DRAFT_136969 [Jimgerdemannia flammicorona]